MHIGGTDEAVGQSLLALDRAGAFTGAYRFTTGESAPTERLSKDYGLLVLEPADCCGEAEHAMKDEAVFS